MTPKKLDSWISSDEKDKKVEKGKREKRNEKEENEVEIGECERSLKNITQLLLGAQLWFHRVRVNRLC